MSVRTITYLKNKFKQGATPQGTDYADWLDTMQSMSQQSTPTLQVLTEADLKVGGYVKVTHNLGRYAVPTVLDDDDGFMVPVDATWKIADENTVMVKLASGVGDGKYKVLIK